jgi:imidazole glycerol-phosphate synthase
MTHQSSGISFFLHTQAATNNTLSTAKPIGMIGHANATTQLTKRLVVALDVRTNDDGDLVVTKGDQYDVRERNNDTAGGSNQVRNLGKPVSLAQRYYNEGADEIAFLNITSFRHGVIEDMPMLAVLEAASETIFVPLTVGGGIRSYTDPDSNKTWSALEVASRYFRAGADKVSLGSDAVDAAEHYMATGEKESSIQSISHVYGAQAVVVSIDPKRVYVASPADAPQHVVVAVGGDDNDEKRYCWWQCTVKGGREVRDICAVTLAKAVQAMGAGEIMLNSIDMDGQCNGYDIELMRAVSEAVSIPVIASSGAGRPEHFQQVFEQTKVQAALAAGMFHRKEVEIEHVKQYLREAGIASRIT